MPIGALFAVTLWLGNSAYLHLSVSFIQMIKASMPLLVYACGCLFGIEAPNANMAVVVAGIVLASYGELRFVLVGVLLQCGSLVSEALRLTLIQILLQRRGIKLNPVTTMYYVSPVCFAFLVVPFVAWEAQALLADGGARVDALALGASVLSAFGESLFLCVCVVSFLFVARVSNTGSAAPPFRL